MTKRSTARACNIFLVELVKWGISENFWEIPLSGPHPDPMSSGLHPSTECIRPLTAPLEVRDAGPGKGRGVFSTGFIRRGLILETVPVIVVSKENYLNYGQFTELKHYTFAWPGGGQAIALGMTGSMWNHKTPPNVGFVRNTDAKTITFSALEPIAPGEECCIDYGRNLWFPCESSGDETLQFFEDDDAGAFLSGFAVDSS